MCPSGVAVRGSGSLYFLYFYPGLGLSYCHSYYQNCNWSQYMMPVVGLWAQMSMLLVMLPFSLLFPMLRDSALLSSRNNIQLSAEMAIRKMQRAITFPNPSFSTLHSEIHSVATNTCAQQQIAHLKQVNLPCISSL